MLVHLAGARWAEREDEAPTLLLHDVLEARPLDKVAKRVDVGPEHSFAQHVDFAVSKADPDTYPEVHTASGPGVGGGSGQ